MRLSLGLTCVADNLQERAYVTGLIAANHIIERFGIGRKVEILPVRHFLPYGASIRLIDSSPADFIWLPLPAIQQWACPLLDTELEKETINVFCLS